MRNLHYVFTLRCPQCGRQSFTCGTKEKLPPHGYCDCLTNQSPIEVEIIRVEVFKGAIS